MKCRLIRNMGCDPCPEFPDGVKPEGTIIDHPKSPVLVRMGVAEAADKECEEAIQRLGYDRQKLAQAQQAYKRVDAGIIPEDYEAFDLGIMTGYTSEGEWIPGPNYGEYQRQKQIAESPLILPENMDDE